MNDMRELLSGALPAPQDEPQQRDVIDAAMDWGTRRRRRDWALSGAAALAVIAVGTGVAAMSDGSGNGVTSGTGPRPSSTHSSFRIPPPQAGSWWTPSCGSPGTAKGNLADYCRLFEAQQNFNVDFAEGSAPFIQAALPTGFTVKTTGTWVLILTGPNGKTNYLFPSAEPASSLDGHPLSCGTPAPPECVETSTADGTVVVAGAPSGMPSAGYVGQGNKDPRVDILLGTSAGGGMNRMAPPTSAEPLLSNAELEKLVSDSRLLQYAKAQLTHLDSITRQLQAMAQPSGSPSSSYSPPPGSFSSLPGSVPSVPSVPSSGATDSWTPPSGGWSSSAETPSSSSS